MERIALVTGSTNNIGKAIAEVLSAKGYHVIITSRDEEEACLVAENLPKKGSAFRVDYSEASSIERLFTFIRERFGRLDALVNNVAYTKNESILACDLATWEYTMNTNLRSYYLCTKFAAEIMKSLKTGSAWYADRMTRIADAISYSEYGKLLDVILEHEYMMKTTSVDSMALLEMLILGLVNARDIR